MLELLKKDKINKISKLSINSYRNHDHLELEIPNCSVVLYGRNGVGKTSILEAISTFSSSRGGLRNAKFYEMVKCKKNDFSISLDLNVDDIIKLEINSYYNNEKKIRKLSVNGKETGAFSLVKKSMPMLWVGPYAERIFNEGPSSRRNFLDNLVINFDDAHGKRLGEYEKLLKQRSKLLKENKGDDNWLNALEKIMAKLAVSISSSRLDFTFRLNTNLEKSLENFPNVKIEFNDCLEKDLESTPAIDIEDKLIQKFKSSRRIDSILGGCQYGSQKSDYVVTNLDKNISAKMCSSGEQKSLLISLVIACSRAIKESINCPPIILLDDIFSHLDNVNKTSLLKELSNLRSQSWITITEKERFLHNNKDFCYYSL